MSSKIKFHTFNALFRLFAYLADRTGGWRVFVRPKLLLGSLIVGLGLASSMPINAQTQLKKGSSGLKKTSFKFDGPLVIHNEPIVTCYERVTEPIDTANIIFDVVEQMPQYPGGDSAMIAFIHKNITPQPIVQCYNGIGGKVICRFIVDTDGSLNNFTILRSLDPTCDKEAIRVLKLLPKFIPGKLNGRVVKVYYTVPVIFKP
ncbi:MAG: energy transducer TonB [Paludibacter sp.]|nr:energy transducer TonB [Paludibacter sp.]